MAGPLDPKLKHKLEDLEKRSEELSHALADPEITRDMERYRATTRSYAELQPIIDNYRDYTKAAEELDGARELLQAADDAEMRAMASDEIKTLEARLEELESELRLLLLPSDPNDGKNVVLEIRAGTGGDEATLFAAELFRMYTRYADDQKWKVSTTSASGSEVGGVKEVIALIEGARAVVSNDTGPVHLASALHVPVLGIYGPNTPVLYGPLAKGSRAFYRGLPCSPCLRTSNYRSSRCRIHTCMASVPTGEVAGALGRLLDAAAAEKKRSATWTDASS